MPDGSGVTVLRGLLLMPGPQGQLAPGRLTLQGGLIRTVEPDPQAPRDRVILPGHRRT